MKRKYAYAILAVNFFIFICFFNCSKNDVPEKTEVSSVTEQEAEHPEDEHDHEGEKEQDPGHAEEDDHAEEGELLTLDDKTLALIDLKFEEVKTGRIDVFIEAPAKVIMNENSEAHVGPVIPARVNEVMVNLGDVVKKGEALVCLESTELGEKRAEYDRAVACLEVANSNYNRKKKLYEENVVSEKSLLESELEKKNAEIALDYSKKMLLIAGLSQEEINNPPKEHTSIRGCAFHLVSPIGGVIVERNATIGQRVDQNNCLFEIADLSKIWIEADIFEKDLPAIKIGQQIRVKVTAYPDEIFYGKIFFIGHTLHEETRTIKIRSEVNNEKLQLKPGMFTSIEIITGVRENVVVIPKSAVLEDENLKIVFVKEGEEYHRHIVHTGIESGTMVEILEGLHAGDLVVTQGNYQLKSKAMMGKVDPHAGHTH